MTDDRKSVPSVSVSYARTGSSAKANALGMRPMQEQAYEKRGEQYLLIKSPPASGKSRALMFIALDKLANQGCKQAIIVVPEKSIGASFNDEPLSRDGFWADWRVAPRWNLCNAPGEDGGKVKSVGAFLESDDKVLVCTHATFRFAVDRFGVEAFDDRLIAVDEFHHVSSSPDNKLGLHLGEFIARDKVHLVAMTGSYFRGDAEAVLSPGDEAKFEPVTYTYYEQLNGYEFLKQLDIGYFFYSGPYADDILAVLDPAEKTIIHIPNVNSRESTKDKVREVEHIIEALGEWQGTDPATGFQLVRTADGRTLRIADLVDDDGAKRDRVSAALKDPAQKNNRDHVDIIIALGMAKEGFDWIWCEHALTVGYRASLTEIVQIIGRATRDAPGKTRARFTNLIAAVDASDEAVREAVNDTLKAIAASLLMEQVLAPRFEFKVKNPTTSTATPGFNYGEGGYDPEKCNVGFHDERGVFESRDQGARRSQEPRGGAHLPRGLERGHCHLRAGQAFDRARPVRRGAGARGTDAGSPGQDHQGQVPGAGRGGPGGGAPARHRRPDADAASEEDRVRRGGGRADPQHCAGRRRAQVRHGRPRTRHRPDRPDQPVRRSLRHPRQNHERGQPEAGGGRHRRQAHHDHARGGCRVGRPRAPVQARARSAPFRHCGGRLGKAHGRGRSRVHALSERRSVWLNLST